MADTYHIQAIRGATLLLNINCRNSDNTYINLSGYTAKGYVREKFTSSGILLDLQPQVHSSFISGLITLSGAATGLAVMPVGQFVYDIDCSGSNEYVFKPVRGYFSVGPEATY